MQQGYTKNGTGINLDCTILSDSCYTSFQDVAFAFFGSGMGGGVLNKNKEGNNCFGFCWGAILFICKSTGVSISIMDVG